MSDASTQLLDRSAASADSSPSPRAVPVTIIAPKAGWHAVDFRELWQQRELLYFLIWRDIKVTYKQTVIGAAWVVLQPLVTMVIFTVIFGTFARIPSEGIPYPVFVFAGLLPWTFFSKAVSTASLSLVVQAPLLTKVYFPRLFLPTACTGAALVDFGLNLAVYAGLMLWYAATPGPSVALLPLLVLLITVMAAGLGYILASLTVVYRDFKFVVPFLLQVWMYVSPIIYPTSLLPASWRWVMRLNPLAGMIDAFRSTLLGRPLDLAALSFAAAFAAGIFVFGLYSFRRTERHFADLA